MLTKIIIELSNIGTEKSQTVAQKTACQITQRNCSREAEFSAQFSVLSVERTSVDLMFPPVSENQIPTYPGHQCGLGIWEGSLTVEGIMSIGVPGRRCLILIFSLFIWLLQVSAAASGIFHLQPRYWSYLLSHVPSSSPTRDQTQTPGIESSES